MRNRIGRNCGFSYIKMKLLKLINLENTSEQEANTFSIREAARAIVFDSENMIALLYSKKFNYYKLPGGGVEEGEDYETALKRECQEEVGCDVDVISEIGMIIEYRKFCELKQISYCYLAKVKGKKGSPNFTENELEGGFEQLWLPYEEVKRLIALKTDKTNFEGSAYIIRRDSAILNEAEQFIKKIL